MRKIIVFLLAMLLLPITNYGEAATSLEDKIILSGQKYIGAPYLFGAAVGDTSRFDCSSFTSTIFKENGISLPRSSREQAKTGTFLSRGELKKGDLLFYDLDFDSVIDHVSVYISKEQMIHATTSSGVTITASFSTYWDNRFVTARRVIPEQTNPVDTIYTVRSGDSLFLIARNFGVTVENLREWNQLSSNVIYIGQKLSVKPVQMPSYNKSEHIVQRGESLWVVSQKYNVTITDLMKWNSLKTTNIYPGQKLFTNRPQQDQATYVVKAGDSLWKIANYNGTTIQSLIEKNNLQSTTIYVGQTLYF